MAKAYTGEIRNGAIVLEGAPPALPEGAKVRVELTESPPELVTMADRLRAVAWQGFARELLSAAPP